ncbi:hypothetical protein LTR17_015104 [Elasticomyces elasticus]|nr:hypothetical protein LTR17_015104 [Elasticomyces elasticus]
MASAAEVLNLPELLENILLQLPIRDLLFAQKRALFFTPGSAKDVHPDPEVHVFNPAMHGAVTVATNPLLLYNGLGASDFDSPIVLRGPRKADPHSSCHRMFMTQPPVALQIRSQNTSWQHRFYRLHPSQRTVDRLIGALKPCRFPVEAHQTFRYLVDCHREFDARYDDQIWFAQLRAG